MMEDFSHSLLISSSDLFTSASFSGTRGHCYKILVPYSHRHIARHRFLSVRVSKAWNSSLNNLVDSDSLDNSKKGLTSFLGDLLFFISPPNLFCDTCYGFFGFKDTLQCFLIALYFLE